MIVEGSTDEQVHVHGYDLYIEPEGPGPRVRRPHPRALRGRTRAVRSAPHRADGLMTRRRHLGIATVLAGVAMAGQRRPVPTASADAPICRCRPGSWRGRRLRRCEFLCGARRVLVAAAARRRSRRWADLVDTRRPVIRGLEFLTKSIGVFLFGVLMWAAWWGNPNGAVNIAGDALLIWFWVGLQLVSFLFGDVWRLFNPYVTIADSGRGFEPRFGVRKPPRSGDGAAQLLAGRRRDLRLPVVRTRLSLDRQPSIDRRVPHRLLGGDDRRRSRGRSRLGAPSRWLRRVVHEVGRHVAVHRDDDGRLRLRSPLAGLSTLPDIPGTVPFIPWCSARPRSTASPAARSGSTSQVNRPAGAARSAARSACSSSPAWSPWRTRLPFRRWRTSPGRSRPS